MYGQTFEVHDVAIIGLLIVLEGVLSIDNALVLGVLAKRLPKHQQSRALTYGLVGAFVFRILAIAAASILLSWTIAKLFGGAYLIFIAVKHFFFTVREPAPEQLTVGPDGMPLIVERQMDKPLESLPEKREVEAALKASAPLHGGAAALNYRTAAAESKGGTASFWPTVAVIELTDVAFAIDSILAAIAMVSTVPKPEGARFHPKLWVVVTGGMIGVILMRFAAVLFIKLLERFPRFETSAYLLVIVIGLKLVADWAFNRGDHHLLNFHSPKTPEFWVFWLLMMGCFAIGFVPKKEKPPDTTAEVTPNITS